MSSNTADRICDELPVFVAELDDGDNKATYNFKLKPQKAVDGEAQYWPLYLEGGNEGEQFGNMLFKFNGKNGQFRLNVSLDLSDVSDLEFMKVGRGKLDGVLALSPDFKHEFKSKAKKGADGNYTELDITIKNKDKKRDLDGHKDVFSFLWLCENIETGVHFPSGDPMARYDPQ